MAPDNDQTQSFVLLTSGTMVSHFRIIGRIGAGGMRASQMVKWCRRCGALFLQLM